ncbi:ribbon-helix-helix domain-containing protein [Clostridium butyricum]
MIKLANKDLKNRHPFSNSLDNDLWKKFDELSKETGVNKSKLLDKAIELLLNEKESK